MTSSFSILGSPSLLIYLFQRWPAWTYVVRNAAIVFQRLPSLDPAAFGSKISLKALRPCLSKLSEVCQSLTMRIYPSLPAGDRVWATKKRMRYFTLRYY